MAKTDLEIAQECVMEPIEEVAKKVRDPARYAGKLRKV